MSDLLDELNWVDDAEVARRELAGLWWRLGDIAHRCQTIALHEGLYASRREFQVFDQYAVEVWALRTQLEADPERFGGLDLHEREDVEAIVAAIEQHWAECRRRSACFMRWHALPDDEAAHVRTIEP